MFDGKKWFVQLRPRQITTFWTFENKRGKKAYLNCNCVTLSIAKHAMSDLMAKNFF